MGVGGVIECQVRNSDLDYHNTSICQMPNATLVCAIFRSTETDALSLMTLLLSLAPPPTLACWHPAGHG